VAIIARYFVVLQPYMMASRLGSFGEVHPRISPGDKGFDWGIVTSKVVSNSSFAD